MFFDEVKLSKKSWHYVLMKFTWGKNTPQLWSFCPYFWLSIFNVIILPLTFVFRSVQWVFRTLDKYLFEIPFEKFMAMNLEDPEMIRNMWYNEIGKIPKKSAWSKNDRWEIAEEFLDKLSEKWRVNRFSPEFTKMINDKISKYQESLDEKRRLKREREREKEILREQREAKSRERAEKLKSLFSPLTNMFNKPDITKIVMRTKKVVSFVLITAVVLTLSYYLIIGTIFLINYFENTVWSTEVFFVASIATAKYITAVVIAVNAVYFLSKGVYLLLRKPVSKLGAYMEEKYFFQNLKMIFTFIGNILFTPVKFVIIKPFMFFAMYFKAFKNDNCPAIVWEEEN